MEQPDFYELTAQNYAAATYLLGIDAVVMLEDMNDEWFWKQTLKNYRPAKYQFVAGTRNNESSTTSTGCGQCLKFQGFFSQRFFTCIDSDFRYLNGENISADNGIVQTYTYSWENHCAYHTRLNKGMIGFDFALFMTEFSAIIHKGLIFLLFQQQNGLNHFTPKQLKKCIAQQYKKGDEVDNGKAILKRIGEELECKLNNSIGYDTFDYKRWSEFYETKGVNKENAYLYVRGHNLYNMLLSIGNKLYTGTNTDFEKDILLAPISFDIYPEIQKVGEDINNLNHLN